MKFLFKALAVMFLAISFAGCAACSSKDRGAVVIPPPVVTKAVSTPVVAPVKTETVVETKAEVPVAEAEKLPRAVLK